MESELAAAHPVIIDVVPTTCSLTMTRARDPKGSLPYSLAMNVRLASRREIRMPDGRSLSGAEWSMTFYEEGQDNEFTKLHNAIGMLNYFESMESGSNYEGSPEGCYAWANLDSPTFAVLREMALNGKLPRVLRLHARGMTYGFDPDGSEKVWDVKARPNIPIESIDIITHLVDEAAEPEDPDADPFETPTAQPENFVLTAVRETNKAMKAADTKLLWVIGLLAAAVVLLLR